MRRALVAAPICPLMTEPCGQCERADEALHGMRVDILEEASQGWARVRTAYRYEGYARLDQLNLEQHQVGAWEDMPKQVVLRPAVDVQFAPKVQSYALATLPRGALAVQTGEPDAQGWIKVLMADGREGYAKASAFGTQRLNWDRSQEQALRNAFMAAAKAYLGAQYRWGGKTPLGIDCSGLVSMAYLLNGVTIYRDAAIKPGFDLKEIPAGQAGPGDLVFFPGHVAMLLEGGRIIHATSYPGSDGVVINSLVPGWPDSREDLLARIKSYGSIF